MSTIKRDGIFAVLSVCDIFWWWWWGDKCILTKDLGMGIVSVICTASSKIISKYNCNDFST
jgi:hypothetical protein